MPVACAPNLQHIYAQLGCKALAHARHLLAFVWLIVIHTTSSSGNKGGTLLKRMVW